MKACRIILVALLALSCTQKYYVTDYQNRLEAHGGALAQYMALPEGASAREKEYLQFLYAYMPLADVTDYGADFYLEQVRATLATRREMDWKVPEREFRHFVLPLRVNNENLDSARLVFARELKPRVKGLGMQEAILEVNHWCHEKVTYQPSDARTSSPLNTVKNALGRCGEESTFTVAALRSVGIPARQVYTPRWAHTDDNHAWVEAWADGQWHFLGACEPEPVLDLGWFNAPASRAMLMHTKVFGKYDGPEEVVLESPDYTEVNLIDNYARTARIDFTVRWADDLPTRLAGMPAAGARVDFCIYNYAEFYPAVTKYADEYGRTFLSAGLGDMLVWASVGDCFGYTRVRFGEDTEAVITLRYVPDGGLDGLQERMLIVPPPETAVLPEVTPEQRALCDRRVAAEDSLRHAYEATFPAGDPARGNWRTVQAFRQLPDQAKVNAVLASLSTKDLHDITPELLQAYYDAEPFCGARVENEFLTDFYGFFRKEAPEATLEGIEVYDNPRAWNIPMSPEGVWRTRLATPRSLDIYTVAWLRAHGTEAQKDPVTGKVQMKQDGVWMDFRPGEAAREAPKGTLRLRYTPDGVVPNPKYYTHFTLSKIVDGRPQLLAYDEEEVDMGGGMDWAGGFGKGVQLDEGLYLLVSGNRLSDGSVPVSLRFFALPAGQTVTQDLLIDKPADAVPVIGSFDAESRILVDGQEVSILSRTGRGYYALALLEPGKEPTNHALRDLAAAKKQLEAWGRPIVLLCTSGEALERLRREEKEGRYGTLPATVLYGVAPESLLPGAPPVVLLADSFNRVFFRSEGYTIGLGEQLSGLAARL